jgi:hypothetical protein
MSLLNLEPTDLFEYNKLKDHLERSMVLVMTHGPDCQHLNHDQRRRIASQAVSYCSPKELDQLNNVMVEIRQALYTQVYARCVALAASILHIRDDREIPLLDVKPLPIADDSICDTLDSNTEAIHDDNINSASGHIHESVTIKANTLLNGRHYDSIASASATTQSVATKTDIVQLQTTVPKKIVSWNKVT